MLFLDRRCRQALAANAGMVVSARGAAAVASTAAVARRQAGLWPAGWKGVMGCFDSFRPGPCLDPAEVRPEPGAPGQVRYVERAAVVQHGKPVPHSGGAGAAASPRRLRVPVLAMWQWPVDLEAFELVLLRRPEDLARCITDPNEPLPAGHCPGRSQLVGRSP